MTHFPVRGPFTVGWIDGRKTPLEGSDETTCVWDDADLRALWEPQRIAGAVGLLDGRNVWQDHDYTEAKITDVGLAPGARVRHRDHPDLTGRVERFEYHASGRLSAIPLVVYWDQSEEAAKRLGWFWIYQSPESLERLDHQPAEVPA